MIGDAKISSCKEIKIHNNLDGIRFNCVCEIWANYLVQSKNTKPPVSHGEVFTWKRFPHYWPRVREICGSPLYSPNQGPVIWSVGVDFVVSLNKLLKKQIELSVI